MIIIVCKTIIIIISLLKITSVPFGSPSQVKISRYDGTPLTSSDLQHAAVVEVSQRTSVTKVEPRTLMLPVSTDGNVHVGLKLQAQVLTLLIRVSTLTREGGLPLWLHVGGVSVA